MAFKEEIRYAIHGIDKVIDEKGNTFIALREISWGDSDSVKLDLRKWYTAADGKETLGKGVSFLTEDGPAELARVLITEGFGVTDELFDAMSDREDFTKNCIRSLSTKLSSDDLTSFKDDPETYLQDAFESDDTEYYDPRELLVN